MTRRSTQNRCSRKSALALGALPSGLVALLALTLPVLPCARGEPFNCKFEAQGKQFDLSPLDKVVHHTSSYETPPTTSKSDYALSLCSPLPRDGNIQDRDQCPEGTRACLTVMNVKEGESDRTVSVVPIARDDLDPVVKFLPAVKGRPDSLAIVLRGPQYQGHPRWANLTLFCDPSSDSTEPTSWQYRRTETEGVLSVEWTSKNACPLGASGQPEGNEPKAGTGVGKLFGDFILLIIVLLALYFVVGAYYQYSQFGSRGWDLIPNRAFWSDLPYVLRDLFRGAGRNSGGYSAL